MKKIVLVNVVALVCMSVLFCGCKKQEQDSQGVESANEENLTETDSNEDKETAENFEFKPGLYSREYEEEFADGLETFTDYLFFGDDGKGFSITQDDMTITYSDGSFTDEGGNSYSFVMTGDGILELDNNGIKSEYTYAGDSLTQDIIDNMRYFPDGTLKINNPEAGYAFENLITSDTINFYSLTSTVDYAAEGDDLEGMSAAYIEMTDKYLPVLFVRTPKAPKEVGYEHALQYVDGKIYNIIGLDKIDMVYQDVAVIAASSEDENGKTQYYYMPDENGELYVFASRYTEGGEDKSFRIYDKDGTFEDASEEEFEGAVSGAVAGSEPLADIEWKSLDKAI